MKQSRRKLGNKKKSKGKSAFAIAREVVNQTIAKGQPFTYKQLGNRIVKAGGIMYVEVGLTVADYLKMKEEAGRIEYVPKKDKYYVLKTNPADDNSKQC